MVKELINYLEKIKIYNSTKKVFIEDLYITDHSINKTSFKIICGQGFMSEA